MTRTSCNIYIVYTDVVSACDMLIFICDVYLLIGVMTPLPYSLSCGSLYIPMEL